MRITNLALAAAAFAFAACKPPAPADGAMANQASTDSVKAGIDAMNRAYTQHLLAGHADSVAAMYAADATLMPPNMAPAHGAEAIRAALNGMMAMGKPTSFTMRSENVVVAGPMAIERGRWTYGMMGPNNMAMADSGNYLVHWHNVGGKWMLMDDIWNSDHPAMAMPAAAPARHRS